MTKKFTQEEVAAYFKEHGYTLISEYVNSSTKVIVRNQQGNEYGVTFGNFKQGNRPERRSHKNTGKRSTNRHTYESISARVSPYGYKLKSYVTASNLILETPSGYTWHTSLHDFLRGSRHPLERVGNSKGETIIYNALRYSGIDFKYQHSVTIKGNKHIFDFYLPELNTFIEYNGEQHYREVKFFGSLIDRQARDYEKESWATSKNYLLISVPYTLSTPNDIITYIKSILPDMEEFSKDKFYFTQVMAGQRTQEIAEYYLHHTIEETLIKYPISLPRLMNIFKEVYGNTKKSYVLEEALSYYIGHSITETHNRYGLSETTLLTGFKRKYGMSKQAYKKYTEIGDVSQYSVAEYYLTHTLKETVAKYRVSNNQVVRYFNHVYGNSKRVYIEKHTEPYTDKQQEVTHYLLTHTLLETTQLYGYSKPTLQDWFKKVYGMTKTEYLNSK